MPDLNYSVKVLNLSMWWEVSPFQSVYGHAKNFCMNLESLDRVSWTRTTSTLCVTVDTLLHFTRHVPTIVNLRLSNRFAATTLLAYEKSMPPLFISGHFSGYFELYQCSIFSDWKASQPIKLIQISFAAASTPPLKNPFYCLVYHVLLKR